MFGYFLYFCSLRICIYFFVKFQYNRKFIFFTNVQYLYGRKFYLNKFGKMEYYDIDGKEGI